MHLLIQDLELRRSVTFRVSYIIQNINFLLDFVTWTRLRVAPYVVVAQVAARCRTPALILIKSGVVFGSARRVGEATEDSPPQLFSSTPLSLTGWNSSSLFLFFSSLVRRRRRRRREGEARLPLPVCSGTVKIRLGIKGQERLVAAC